MQKLALLPDFLQRKPPPNYIAGLGRGANGFTTRSDIGPARDSESIPLLDSNNVPIQMSDNVQENPDNETGLFNSLPYEQDDEEADLIYNKIDNAIDERRKSRREAREQEELVRYRKERPKIQQQFADLKRSLKEVTEYEWANLPEVGDLVRKKSKPLFERLTPVGDVIRVGAGMSGVVEETPQQVDGTVTDLVQFGQARDKVLGLKLDKLTNTQSTIDPQGYLTSLNSQVLKTTTEISDIKKARALLKSVTATNPHHAPGWIAAARLEEVAQKNNVARDIIMKGCKECPGSEDVWLEAARLNDLENSKAILAKAIKHVPKSVKIWQKAVDLEKNVESKKKVLRRALENIPNSVKIWKDLVGLEDDEDDAKILLARAVECVPLSIDLWLALANLETYDNSKKVLNKARQSIPTSHEIWITAAKLEEKNGNLKMIRVIIPRAVSTLKQKGASIDREGWVAEAEKCEAASFNHTCQAIIDATIGLNIEPEDLLNTLLDDAETCTNRGSIHTARCIYEYALGKYPQDDDVWRQASMHEKKHGTYETTIEILDKATVQCPQAQVLWLMLAKEKWQADKIQEAKEVLESAFKQNPNSEQIWLAAAKLEMETKNYDLAKMLLLKARSQADTARVWMKSVCLERILGNIDEALSQCSTALSKFPRYAKLYMIQSQLHEYRLDFSSARQTLQTALKNVTKSQPHFNTLWILACRLEEKIGIVAKTRALIEKARQVLPNDPGVWNESVLMENRAGNTAIAKSLLSKALQACPNSGLLWSNAILSEPRAQRKARSMDALKKCENDPLVLITIARLFWAEQKLEKARNWFTRACKVDSDLGDAWAWLLRFEMSHGTEVEQSHVISQCVLADPRHGEKWQIATKDLKNIGKKTDEIIKIVATRLPTTV